MPISFPFLFSWFLLPNTCHLDLLNSSCAKLKDIIARSKSNHGNVGAHKFCQLSSKNQFREKYSLLKVIFPFLLSYLHSTCDPPILHGNLTCDTIFIQHNGLVKIGSVAPDIIHQNVKTCRDNIVRNRHFLAPEWGTSQEATLNTAIDIFAFGMCALETAALELLTTNPPGSSASGGGSGNGSKDSKGKDVM